MVIKALEFEASNLLMQMRRLEWTVEHKFDKYVKTCHHEVKQLVNLMDRIDGSNKDNSGE
jgi:hypothetical protein